jgi:peptide deformylase
MALLPILEFPDPRLRTEARPVAAVDERIRTLAADMLETMYDSSGIGLAATQVDVHERVVVIDVSETRDEPRVFVNPELELSGDTVESPEGCLSVPEFYENVTRRERAKVRALGLDGEPFELDTEGLLAICIQHECDHLAGKLFVDYLSGLKRQRIRRKLEKRHRQSA